MTAKKMANQTTLRRAAIHEAGHAVACVLLGIPMVAVTITDGSYLYRGRYRAPRHLGAQRLATMCLSGPAAEAALCGPITDGGDREDIAMARTYLGGDELATGAEIYAAALGGPPSRFQLGAGAHQRYCRRLARARAADSRSNLRSGFSGRR